MIDGAYVRRLGNLPAAVTDELLAPHLEGARGTVAAMLDGRTPEGVDEERLVAEATGCFAIAYALPVLNTFFLSQASRVPRRVAETDYVFHEPGEVLRLAEYWKRRGYEALRGVGRTSGPLGVTVI